MRKGSMLIAGIGALVGLGSLSRREEIILRDHGFRPSRLIPQFWYQCRKTVTAAQLKRAAKKRRNIRARSKKK